MNHCITFADAIFAVPFHVDDIQICKAACTANVFFIRCAIL